MGEEEVDILDLKARRNLKMLTRRSETKLNRSEEVTVRMCLCRRRKKWGGAGKAMRSEGGRTDAEVSSLWVERVHQRACPSQTCGVVRGSAGVPSLFRKIGGNLNQTHQQNKAQQIIFLHLVSVPHPPPPRKT
ncbi:hypothetical protein ATANTOWER_022187 [Ataeniobius toweri]|uniref:Uncharacterized protein n=1 Tax=Ataeniobius toweri TaxID=208326 RepID=A0ABU7BHN6_9TELE|nr:hypothetical protein [Ataeniobius toweri]